MATAQAQAALLGQGHVCLSLASCERGMSGKQAARLLLQRSRLGGAAAAAAGGPSQLAEATYAGDAHVLCGLLLPPSTLRAINSRCGRCQTASLVGRSHPLRESCRSCSFAGLRSCPSPSACPKMGRARGKAGIEGLEVSHPWLRLHRATKWWRKLSEQTRDGKVVGACRLHVLSWPHLTETKSHLAHLSSCALGKRSKPAQRLGKHTRPLGCRERRPLAGTGELAGRSKPALSGKQA